MHRKIYAVIVSVLMALTVFLVGSGTFGTVTAHAAEIPTSGLTAGDATVLDINGNSVPDNGDLSWWTNYSVAYDWSIPNGTTIKAGDTAVVELPNSAQAKHDLNIPLVNDLGVVVGTFSIKAGETTGTITFNDVLTSQTTNRKGTLSFYVRGSNTSSDVNMEWGLNKVGWISEKDANGVPTKLTWNVAFNPKGINLGNVTVTDTLGPNQTFVPGSVIASTGSYDSAGHFSTSGSTTPTVSQSGNVLTFGFTDVTTAVNMTYNTVPDLNGAASGTWKNSASLNGKTVDSQIAWGGSGTGNGTNDQDLGEVILTKMDKSTGMSLAGAEYEIRDANNDVIMSGLSTESNGELRVKDLAAGSYTFVETKAPEGYELSTEPIPFTIAVGQTSAVTVNAFDEEEAPSVTYPGGPENPENPEEPENPGTTTPPTNPGNPGTTTPPTHPENPGTTTPPTTTPTHPENPGTTTPTHPETPGTTTPTHPSTTYKPGSGSGAANGGAGGYVTGNNGYAGSSSGNNGYCYPVASGSGNGYVGSTLPQTGERRSNTVSYWIAALALVAVASGLWYDWKRKHH